MRVGTQVLVLFLLLPALVFGAQASRRIVLDPASLGQAPLQKTVSTMSQTGFSFHLAGVNLSDKTMENSIYQEVSPIADSLEKYAETSEDGLPQLPLYSQLVGIPDQAGVRVEITSSSYQIIENVDVKPVQPEPFEINADQVMPFTKNQEFYQKDQFYPSEIVQVQEPVIFRDLRMVSTVVSPIQYNPARHELKVYTNVDYRLVYEGTDTRNQKIRRNNTIAESFLPMYRSLVPNADEMLASYQPIRGGYLILYPRDMPDSLIQVLARWKHLKGYSVVAVRDSAIAHTSGSPSATQISNYIRNAYNTWAVPPEYVCIMGSIFVTNKIIDWSHDGQASDHQYACVDGSDYFADIMVTRMSMPLNNSVMRTTIWKGIIYDKTPFMGDPAYWTRALSCAGNVGAVTPRLNVLWVREMLLRRGFTQVDTAFGWGSGDPNTAPITASFNNGVCLSSYRGWGFPQNWGSPGFYVSHLNALDFNNKIGPCFAPTCGTGNFGTQDCFGEHWCTMGALPDSLKGGPGYFGASGEDTKTRYNNPFLVGYYESVLMRGINNFASACFMGKIELWNTFPFNRAVGGDVEHYTNTFNPLGEPEFEVRTGIPQAMTVTYPSTVPVGTSLLNVHVNGSNGLPLENAYVCLVKGRSTEQVFVGGKTNAGGDLALNFATTTADTMFVTATAHNYIPHCGFTLVQTQSVAVNISAITLDDDNIGNSHGNSDGNANPSETVEFSVTLRNFGSSITATNVTATLTSSNPLLFVTVPTQSYGSIANGATATSGKFAALLSSDIPQGEHFILQLNITSDQGSWSAAVPIDIKNMLFSNRGITYPGNSNGVLDPGETSNLVISMQNLGQLAGTSLTGVITTSDTAITIVDGTADFGSIAIGATGSNTASPFSVQARSHTYPGRNSNFDLLLTSSNGSVTHMPFSLVIGNVSASDPVGPDSYGYYLYDNTDGGYVGCPSYNWVEISPFAGGSGTRVNFPLGTDDESEVVDGLPFNLRFYGHSYSYMLVSINGFVAFDTATVDFIGHHWASAENNEIPEASAPDGLIAPFWDDLEYSGNNGVFRYSDSANHRYIIEWKACTHAAEPNHHPETFEMIIYDPAYYPTPTGDCEIVFQYSVCYNDDSDTWSSLTPGLYSTVGIQNPSNTDGLQYTFDNIYHPAAAVLQAGRAIKITTVTGTQLPPEISINPTSFVKSGSVGQLLTDTLTISNVGQATLDFILNSYQDQVRILDYNGDPTTPVIQSIQQPIDITITPGAKPGDEEQPLYPPVIMNQGGPDTYGYTWKDSNEPGGPAYGWVDISGVGTTDAMSGDDVFVGPIDMGISFPFYENTFSQIYIAANGILTFGSGTTAYSNTNIPNATAPNDFIAPLWDDLSPQIGGTVMHYHDVANNRFIVSFTNVPFWSGTGGTGSINFEAILYPDGRIFFEYGSIDGGTRGLSQLTIGIENTAGIDGLQVVYNAAYLAGNMAVFFKPPVRWLSCGSHTGNVIGGTNAKVPITFDATYLTTGTYTGHLSLGTNDPDESSLNIPISFTVGGTGTPNIVQTPASFNDTLQTNQSSQFNVKVKNTGTAILTAAFSPAAGWITVATGPYNINPGDSIVQTVTLNSTGLTPAVYNSSLVTNTNDPAHSQVSMPIQLRVAAPPPPHIIFTPTAFVEVINEGAIVTRNLVIKNTGSSNLILGLSAVEGSLLAPPPPDDNSLPTALSNGNGDGRPHLLNDWLFIAPAADTIAPNDSLIAVITLNATVVGSGDHTGHIALSSNDPNTPTASVPVNITVQTVGPNCNYVTGDANGSGTWTGQDVTYGVRFFKGGNAPLYSCECTSGHTWYVSGDVNGSCSFTGQDVTRMVLHFKSGVVGIPCPDCPPSSIFGHHPDQKPADQDR